MARVDARGEVEAAPTLLDEERLAQNRADVLVGGDVAGVVAQALLVGAQARRELAVLAPDAGDDVVSLGESGLVLERAQREVLRAGERASIARACLSPHVDDALREERTDARVSGLLRLHGLERRDALPRAGHGEAGDVGERFLVRLAERGVGRTGIALGSRANGVGHDGHDLVLEIERARERSVDVTGPLRLTLLAEHAKPHANPFARGVKRPYDEVPHHLRRIAEDDLGEARLGEPIDDGLRQHERERVGPRERLHHDHARLPERRDGVVGQERRTEPRAHHAGRVAAQRLDAVDHGLGDWPVLAAAREHVVDERRDAIRHRALERADVRSVGRQSLRRDGHRGVSHERQAAREELEQDRSERVHVRSSVDRAVLELLGSHVRRRTHDHAGAHHVGGHPVGHARDAEVGDDHALAGDHDVLGLEIPVNDADDMRRGETAGDLRGDAERLREVDGARPRVGPERGSLDELHREEACAPLITVEPEVERARHVPVGDPPRASFTSRRKRRRVAVSSAASRLSTLRATRPRPARGRRRERRPPSLPRRGGALSS